MYVSTFSTRAFLASSCGVPGSTLLTCRAQRIEQFMSRYLFCVPFPHHFLRVGNTDQGTATMK